MESNNNWNLEEWTEIQKDELKPVCLSLTTCSLDDMGVVQTRLLPFINRVVHIPGSGLTEGEGELREELAEQLAQLLLHGSRMNPR